MEEAAGSACVIGVLPSALLEDGPAADAAETGAAGSACVIGLLPSALLEDGPAGAGLTGAAPAVGDPTGLEEEAAPLPTTGFGKGAPGSGPVEDVWPASGGMRQSFGFMF